MFLSNKKIDECLICFFAELVTVWGIAFLHWHEELNSKETAQEKAAEIKDNVKKELLTLWRFSFLDSFLMLILLKFSFCMVVSVFSLLEVRDL